MNSNSYLHIVDAFVNCLTIISVFRVVWEVPQHVFRASFSLRYYLYISFDKSQYCICSKQDENNTPALITQISVFLLI